MFPYTCFTPLDVLRLYLLGASLFISIFIVCFLEQNRNELHVSVSQASFFLSKIMSNQDGDLQASEKRSFQGMVVCGEVVGGVKSSLSSALHF